MLRKLGLLALGLGVATLCWFALGSQRAGQLISMEEGRAIYGADEDCGDWKTNPTGGCQPNIYGWGLKFWESCPQTESLVSGTSYKVYTKLFFLYDNVWLPLRSVQSGLQALRLGAYSHSSVRGKLLMLIANFVSDDRELIFVVVNSVVQTCFHQQTSSHKLPSLSCH